MKYKGMKLEHEFLSDQELQRKLEKAKHKNSDDFEAEPSFKKDNVKVLTLNMFLRPVVKTNFSDYKYERLEEFASVLDDYDIICNQEVFNGLNSFKPTLITLAKKTGFTDFVLGSRPGLFSKFVIDNGLTIMSRFPIVAKDEMIFTKYMADCSLSSKGAIYAKISIDGHYLHLFNTHLQANYYNTFYVYKECINNRTYQVQQLIKFIAEKTEKMRHDDIILVVGDFNISSRKFNSLMMDQFKSRALVDPAFRIFLEPGFDHIYEYENLLKILGNKGMFKVKDLKQEISDEEGGPPTFGGVKLYEDGTKGPVETALAGEADLMTEQSIDYMFELVREDKKNAFCPEEGKCNKHKEVDEKDELLIGHSEVQPVATPFKVIDKTIKVEQFIVEGQDFSTLSDHFGLSVDLGIKDNS